MKKIINHKILLPLIIIFLTLNLFGCFNDTNNTDNNIEKLREAITNQDYNAAKIYAETIFKREVNNREARIILDYLKYEDDMLLATFWEDDITAMKYIAPISPNINKNDPRFEAPVLVLAAAWGKTEMVKILLEAGADPNYGSDKDGMTALMWACKSFKEQLEMIEALLEAGADINAKSIYNETPISIAEEYLSSNVISIIKEYSK